jgi:hypothetical protein
VENVLQKFKEAKGKLYPMLFVRPTSFVKLVNAMPDLEGNFAEFIYLMQLYLFENTIPGETNYYVAKMTTINRHSPNNPAISDQIFAAKQRFKICEFTSTPSRLFETHEVDVLIPEKQQITDSQEYIESLAKIWKFP